jgi:hypothetical protein
MSREEVAVEDENNYYKMDGWMNDYINIYRYIAQHQRLSLPLLSKGDNIQILLTLNFSHPIASGVGRKPASGLRPRTNWLSGVQLARRIQH